jgi:hyperosmotically inducible periplasmic protein
MQRSNHHAAFAAAIALVGAMTVACGGDAANHNNANTNMAVNRNANTNTVANANTRRDVDYNSPDGLITAKIKLKQLADPEASAAGVDVDTVGGVVTLSGKVETDKQKAASERVAKTVDGVKSVNNQIQVVPESTDHAVEQKDEELQKAVNNVLDNDPYKAFDLKGKVNAGVVTLNGKIANQGDLVRAAMAVRKVPGIKGVVTSAVETASGASAGATNTNATKK